MFDISVAALSLMLLFMTPDNKTEECLIFSYKPVHLNSSHSTLCWNVTEYIYLTAVCKYKFEALIFNLSTLYFHSTTYWRQILYIYWIALATCYFADYSYIRAEVTHFKINLVVQYQLILIMNLPPVYVLINVYMQLISETFTQVLFILGTFTFK